MHCMTGAPIHLRGAGLARFVREIIAGWNLCTGESIDMCLLASEGNGMYVPRELGGLCSSSSAREKFAS